SFLDKQSGGQSYWRDVGTVDTFWGANLELTRVLPELNLYDKEWPIWTHQEQAPPAKFVHNTQEKQGAAYDSLVAGGCIISGATLTESLLFSNVSVAEFSLVEQSVLMPEVTVGKNCIVRKAVVDKGCQIADGTQIGVDIEKDREKYYVSPGGVVLVTPDMLGQNLHSVV
ncbi:MAG: glucose-1-phosphate adenylyltransferase, partial [Pseudomonadota bacterium]